MIKDKFEIEIGNRLREAKTTVPAGSWEAIQSRIKTSSGNLPPKKSAPFSNTGFVVGLVAGAAMLISLAVYSGQEAQQTIDKSIVEVNESPVMKENPPVIIVQNPDSKDSASANATISETGDSPSSSDQIIDRDVKGDNIRNESETSRRTITAKPIAKYDAREINAKNKNAADKRKLASKAQSVTSKNSKAITGVKAKISADKTSGYAPLTVRFDNKGEGQLYYWEFGFRAESNDKTPNVIFEEPGTYTVYLTVENADGQMDEDYIEINVLEGSSIFLPDAFTPNGDGHNDTYKVASATNVKEFYMIITDQTGKTVFESRDVNQEWIFDHSVHGIAGAKYFLTYKAVGVDGKIYSANRKPIHVLY